MIERIKQSYAQLNEREKPLVVGAVILILVVSFYGLIWQPLNSALIVAQKSVSAQQQTLLWLQQNIAKVQLLESSKQRQRFSGSLTQLVNTTAKRHSLTVARMQPGSKHLQIWLEDAPFNNLLSWLSQLNQQGVVIENLDLAAGNNPGEVKVRRLQLIN